MQKNLSRYSFFSIVSFFLAAICYGVLYEHYPRTGWVDAAVYTSYATVADAYSHVDTFGLATNGATYQHSRLSYIGPLRLLGNYFGEIEGRFIFNLILLLIYSISSLKLCNLIVTHIKHKALLLVFFLYNPVVVISVVSGGADGPAGIYSLASLVSLTYALKKRHWIYFFQSGAWFALSLAAHIFSLIPYFFALIPLGFFYVSGKQVGDVNFSLIRVRVKDWVKYLSHYIMGFISILCAIDIFASRLGIGKFFLLYSFGRTQNSLQGSGQKFAQPIDFAIYNSALWIGVVCFFIIAFIFWFGRSRDKNDASHALKLKGTIFGFSLPLFFVFIFDLFVGGSLIISPHYFSLFFPCFAVALVLLFVALDSVVFSGSRFLIVLATVFLSFTCSLFPHNSLASFSASGVDSKSLYVSQIAFKATALRSVEGEVFNIVYSKSNISSAGDYIDYFEGKKRSFNYMDTLAYTFPWSGDKMHRVSLLDGRRLSFELKKDIPTLIFSSTSDNVDDLLDAINKSFGEFSVKARQCGGRNTYTWCLAIVEYENKNSF